MANSRDALTDRLKRVTASSVPDYAPDIEPEQPPTLGARIIARMKAGTFDHELAVGGDVAPRSALAAHRARITATAERQAVARNLRRIEAGTRTPSIRVPLSTGNIAAAAPLIEQIITRLDGRDPVGARGMARLRVLLADGAGPLYRTGHGDLQGRLGAALAEL